MGVKMQVSAPVMTVVSIMGEIPHPSWRWGWGCAGLGSCLYLSPTFALWSKQTWWHLPGPGSLASVRLWQGRRLLGAWPNAGSCLSSPSAWSKPLGRAFPSAAPSWCHVSRCSSARCPHCAHSLALKCFASGKHPCSRVEVAYKWLFLSALWRILLPVPFQGCDFYKRNSSGAGCFMLTANSVIEPHVQSCLWIYEKEWN